jgi:predicted PurR-regulated permease PerM
MESDRPRWSNQTKLVVSLLLLALSLYLLARFRTVIAPFILALILAYVLTPIVNAIQQKLHLARPLVILFCYLILFIVVVTLPAVIVPILANQFAGLNVDIQRLIETLRGFLGHQYTFFGLTFDVSALFEQAIGALQGLMEPVVGQTLELVAGVISSIVWVIFIIIVSFYLIKDYDKLGTWIEEHIPPDYQGDYIRMREQINEIWGSFFRGQLLLGLVVATIFTIIGFILGLPFALALGVLAGLLEFLPSVGHGIWMTTATLVALFLGSTWIPVPNWVFALIIVGLHLFFQQFDLNYLIPRIIGRSVHLPPLVVILGIVSGAVLAGVMGIVLAAPTIASARVLGGYLYANLIDAEPFPDKAAIPLPPPNLRWWRSRPPRRKSHDGSQK